MLKKNGKFILKKTDEAQNSFNNFIKEMRVLVSSKMKRIFNQKAEQSADVPASKQIKPSIEEAFKEALKTIRKLDRFNEGFPVNF